MERPMLPIGTQSFLMLREQGCYYVDKTHFIGKLLRRGRYFFLSRPRRFGKSLFVDTLRQLFSGKESLFDGLWIRDRWDWSVQHPVLSLSFGYGHFHLAGYIHTHVMEQLGELAEDSKVNASHETGPGRFAQLIRELHRRSGRRVAVLVDEYDKPILDALEAPGVARANRDYLKGLYGVIKECDAHIRFAFITGVSKFSKVSLFSGLNNLDDITLDPAYSAICGYTERDLDEVFAPELAGLDRASIRHWYNGYSWLGSERVYNPFDILLLFSRRAFRAYWIETGTPTFLVKTLFKRKVSSLDLEHMTGSEELLAKFDVDEIGTEALLFQTGYLTITGQQRLGRRTRYRLGYPNFEVKLALNEQLLATMVPDKSRRVADTTRLRDLLTTGNLGALETRIRALFSAIPSDWHRRNRIADYEGYYASVVYSWFLTHDLDAVAEEGGSHGRADMVVRLDNTVYIFEFKVTRGTPQGSALEQIKARGYGNKYLGQHQRVYLVGVEFGRQSRNVERFESERLC